jgi:hypothetical protein
MSDARRYRMNAAECLLAAKNCEPTYRSSLLAISAAWYALAIQDEEIDRLLVKGGTGALAALLASDVSSNRTVACR